MLDPWRRFLAIAGEMGSWANSDDGLAICSRRKLNSSGAAGALRPRAALALWADDAADDDADDNGDALITSSSRLGSVLLLGRH